MPTTVLTTALPYSLADDAPFQLTVFVTHKLVGDGARLTNYPAAADWVTTLVASTLTLTTSNAPGTALPLRVVSHPSASAWVAVLPPTTTVAGFPTPTLSNATVRSNPASRMSDHAVDLHLAAIMASPTRRPGLGNDPIARGLLGTLANLDQDGPLSALLRGWRERRLRERELAEQLMRDAAATLGPLTDDPDAVLNSDHQVLPPPDYQKEMVDRPSALQILLEDPESDTRVTEALDALVGQDLSHDPQLQLIVDAHAMRRYYERPEQPQPTAQQTPDPDAVPTPRPDRPDHDFHAKTGSFGSTPALLRRLGLAIDVELEGMDAAGARAALAGATWVQVDIRSENPDLEVVPSRRTAVVVSGSAFAARSSDAWVGGALPLGDDGWVVLDTDPDASGLKLDQHTRNLGRQYASEVNGDPATSAPGTLRATGFALARRDRKSDVQARLRAAESLAADGARELLLDDLVRGIRLEVWDDRSGAWHSLHRRRVTVTGEPSGESILDDTPDVGFLQLSALNRAPGDTTNGYYLHEVVAGWDGWSLSAPRPGLTIVHVEPPGPDGATEKVVDGPTDEPIDGAHVVSRVEPKSLPRLRYGTSYSFRVLAVDLAGNSVPQVPLTQAAPAPGAPLGPGAAESAPDEVALAEAHLERLRAAYGLRDRSGIAAARRAAVIEHLSRTEPEPEPAGLPVELRSGNEDMDTALESLVASVRGAAPRTPTAQRRFDAVQAATRLLAETRDTVRVRPQLRIDPRLFAELDRNGDLLRPRPVHPPAVPVVPVVTAPRPYLRWEPVPAPAVVARLALGTGEQMSNLVIRSGVAAGSDPDGRATAERHLAPPKATQLEAETAGLFDSAIGTSDVAEIRRQYAIALAERGTLLDEEVPSLTDAAATDPQPGIALEDRPGADTNKDHRATLASIALERGRPLGEGQYVVHDVDALRLPYLPDPYASGVSFVFYEAGAPHLLAEPRVLQTVTVHYPGDWPSLQPLRLVVDSGASLDARVDGHVVHVTVPAGEQVRVAVSSTIPLEQLDKFGLWRSHIASVVDESDGYTPDELSAATALMRAASSGWTWWLTPSTDMRLVHAVPAPVRAPELSGLRLLVRPPGATVAALAGLVDVHGPSTDTLVVRASWMDPVDDVAAPGPTTSDLQDVVVRSTVGERERTGILFLVDLQPTGPLADALGGAPLHRAIQTFPDTRYRRVTYHPSGTSRYAELFDPKDVPKTPVDGEPVVLDIPSSARPAAPHVLDTVPVLLWGEEPEPDEPFAWRQVRGSGVRIWLARPWFSSGEGELLAVLVGDPTASGQTVSTVPDTATSVWGADPIQQERDTVSDATTPPLVTRAELLQLAFHDRDWPHDPGEPVMVVDTVALKDVKNQPTVRVLAYQPVYDESSQRWFVDVNLHETPALWPFVRLAVARYQPHSIPGCSLSATTLTSWVQPLPARTLTVSRPDRRRIQVTVSGTVSRLRDASGVTELPGELIGEDSPTGAAAARAAQLQQSRTVRATVQQRDVGAGDLEWRSHTSTLLVASTVDVGGQNRATWTGSVHLPDDSGTPGGDALGFPPLRRPGGHDSQWRVLVEEHELLDADSPQNPNDAVQVPRLVYAGEVPL